MTTRLKGRALSIRCVASMYTILVMGHIVQRDTFVTGAVCYKEKIKSKKITCHNFCQAILQDHSFHYIIPVTIFAQSSIMHTSHVLH